MKGFANLIELYCENGHEEPVLMHMKDTGIVGRDSFYACPKYYPENRDENERACNNNLTIKDYERLLEYLDKMLTQAELSYQQLDMTNMTFKIGQVEYHVIEHSSEAIKIGVKNKKAIQA